MLEQVKLAEEKAALLKNDAKKKAAEIVSQAEASAEQDAEKILSEAKQKAAEIAADAKKTAKAQTEKSANQCEEQKKILDELAKENLDKTAKLIVSLI